MLTIIPTERDVYRPERWRDDALFRPEVRATFARLLAAGWTDAIRTRFPDAPAYTFWDYLRNAWGRDAGLRLDHLLLSPSLAPRLTAAGVDRAERGRPGASDHAPAWITLTPRPDMPLSRTHAARSATRGVRPLGPGSASPSGEEAK